MVGLGFADVALIAWYIGVLVLFEGLLSADNALVLAVMVRHLPKNQQRRVLFYGIWGAVLFRVLALSLSSILLSLWYCKVIGGGYLLYLALAHFLWHRGSSAGHAADPISRPSAWHRGFWGTVTSITLADIAFSIDSILAAVSIAEGFPARFGDGGKFLIVITGGILGIITMRFVVRYFLILLERFPGLEEGAYYLVAWIGLKLLINGFHSGEVTRKFVKFHIPEWLFWTVMIVIAAASLLISPRTKKSDGDSDLSEKLNLLDSVGEPSEEELTGEPGSQPEKPRTKS
jgi:YkoY family integral membrane protein